MKIFHLSDTHGKHHQLSELPAADVIVHSGDFTFAGSEDEAIDFMNWFCDLPYRHKIFIAGNHDDCMYGADGIEGLPEDVHYLSNSGINIDGIHFYGVPLFMQDVMDHRLQTLYAAIPDNTQVLITHQPPLGYCDLADYGNGKTHRGNPELLTRVHQLPLLRCHLFGHEHDAVNVEEADGILFSNAAIVDNAYRLYPEIGRIIEL